MSSNLPLRTIRIPALRQQCLFQGRRNVQPPRAFSTSAPQAFASTSPRRKAQFQQDKSATRAAVKSQMGAAPKVNEMKAQREGAMAEDIGVLQDTIIRPSLGKLPQMWSPKFWSYMWKLLKSKGTALYSRAVYKRCIYKKGIASYLPIDARNNKQLEALATTLYEQIYFNFAKGDMSTVSRFCLPPLLQNFETRIAARGPISMDWKLIGKPSTSVVSHRASAFGDDQPNTAYRQAVIRIASTQKLSVTYLKGAKGWTPNASKSSSPKGLKWVPVDVRQQLQKEKKSSKAEEDMEVKTEGKPKKADFVDNGKPKKLVEYLVLQRRVINGTEDKEWKVWGFAQESTPEKVAEDAEYWSKTLNAQAADASV